MSTPSAELAEMTAELADLNDRQADSWDQLGNPGMAALNRELAAATRRRDWPTVQDLSQRVVALLA